VRASPTIILITDPAWPLTHVEDVIVRAASALPEGALAVQLRDKTATAPAFAASARTLRRVSSSAGACFIVNAPASEPLIVARDEGADGVHVPFGWVEEARDVLGPSVWISTPAHSSDDVAFARAHEVRAILVSPIFETPGKGPPRGTGVLGDARDRLGSERGMATRIYALGGVGPDDAPRCAHAGADGVAVVRALLDAKDPAAVARALDAPFDARRL
jgi:thiamine-phosphate pyrophosphorylase